LKKIKNPTPNFGAFVTDAKNKLMMMKAPELNEDVFRKEWRRQKNATFYRDANYSCLRWDRLKDMPHAQIKEFVDAIGDTIIWLAISRHDGMPISWSDKQDLKNSVVGPHHEAVELYPNADRDLPWETRDHLWVLKDPKAILPYGIASFNKDN
jgi:hypothetical protein